MFRYVFRAPVCRLASLIPLFEYKDPYDDGDPVPMKLPETGWERVKFLFKYTPDGYVSKEYISTVQTAGATFVVAFGVAFVSDSMNSYDRFLTENQATRYISAYEARRKLQDYTILQGVRAGVKYGSKCAVFVAIMGLTRIIIAAYRDKDGILEYTLGGGVAGGIVRLYMGVIGTAVGFGLGAVLGSLLGITIWGFGKLTGTTMKDTQEMLYRLKLTQDEARSQLFREANIQSYDSDALRKWTRGLTEKFAHKLDDRDVQFVVRQPSTNTEDPESEEKNMNDTERNSPSKKDVADVSASKIDTEEVLKEQK